MPDNRDGFARLNGEGDIPQNPIGLAGDAMSPVGLPAILRRRFVLDWDAAVSEPDMIELDPAGPGRCPGDCRRGDFGGSIDQLENALTGGHGRLQDVVFLAQILNGAEETLRVLHEGYKDSERGSAPNYIHSAEPDDASNRNRGEDF